MFYSRYHKSKYFCATCHDVSNPILANGNVLLNLGLAGPEDQSGEQDLITEQYSPFRYFHVERTFSEFMLSAYGLPGGAATNPDFQAQGAPDILRAAKCQDCHMRDVVGQGASQRSAVLRPDDSVEHPYSGQPVHDLTGGNAWVGYILASLVPGSTHYDSVNENLLVNQIHGPLTLDVNQGAGLDSERLLAGVERAKQQLNLAATIKDLSYNSETGSLSFKVQNNTGHKLISGFPEGRRMFVNVKAYQGGTLIQEINPYDVVGGTLKGLSYPYQTEIMATPGSLGANEVYDDALVYEAKPSSLELTGEEKTFHFALATDRYKDNRIPPKGFRIGEAADRLAQPMVGGADASDTLYTTEEYAGGYDAVGLTIATGADYVEVNLYYQTTSREYIEFLRDEIAGTGNLTLDDPGAGGDPAYLIQTDASGFFDGLKAWGPTIWDLWAHNKDVPGAAPILMAQATLGTPGGGGTTCDPLAAPVLDPAAPASNQVTLTWSAVDGSEGYSVYYDQSGKSQKIADVGSTANFTDTNLINGDVYCYKVTAYHTCEGQTVESAFSNIECATPQAVGQDTLADVESVATGRYETTGQGRDKTTVFVSSDVFTAGDGVVIRAYVFDDASLVVSNVSVEIVISGPETVTVTTGNTDDTGMGEAVWNTSAPKKNGAGGTTAGSYTATATAVNGGGVVYSAELVPGDSSASFTLK
jgi:hypothetical protein